MTDKQKNQIPFWKKSWASFIGTFLLSQIIFITFEVTGWIPNLKEIDGTLFGKITEYSFFNTWFTFYETPHFNIFTVFFGIACLIPGIIGAIKTFFLPNLYKSNND